jgi:hypothetical protein
MRFISPNHFHQYDDFHHCSHALCHRCDDWSLACVKVSCVMNSKADKHIVPTHFSHDCETCLFYI